MNALATPTKSKDRDDAEHSRSSSPPRATAGPGSSSTNARFLSASQVSQAPNKVSCLACRQSKVRCSGGVPCQRCIRLAKECQYQQHRRGRFSDKRVQQLEETVEALTRELRNLRRNSVTSPGPSNGLTDHPPPSSSSSAAWYDPARSPRSKSRRSDSLRSDEQPGDGSDSEMSSPSPSPSEHKLSPSSRFPAGEASPSRDPGQPSDASLRAHRHNRGVSSGASSDQEPRRGGDDGLPMLSKPLELLAHASHQAREQDKVQADAMGEGNDASAPSASGMVGCPRSPDQSNSRSMASGPGRGTAFFSIGLCTPRHDRGSRFDPIDRGLITVDFAVKLVGIFVEKLDLPISLLDPILHTFAFIRSRSAILLTAMCWISAQFLQNGAKTAARLESHLKDTLIPAVLTQGYRSVEICQAMIILAAYHPPTPTLWEDRSWSYVHAAIGIASELGMNSRLVDLCEERSRDEDLVRKVRNRERTWLNIWLTETSLSEHLGRHPTLRLDTVIMSCGTWHQHRFAVPADTGVVAVTQLRLFLARQEDAFDRHSRLAAGEQKRLQLDFIVKNSMIELDSWLSTWDGQPTKEDPRPFRLGKAKLYYYYARVLILTKALKCSDVTGSLLDMYYAESAISALAFLSNYIDILIPDGLNWGHNPTVVTPCYVSVLLIWLSASIPNVEQRLGLDTERCFGMIETLVNAMEEAGKFTPHRRGIAGSYAPYLRRILEAARAARARPREEAPPLLESGQNQAQRSQMQPQEESAQPSPMERTSLDAPPRSQEPHTGHRSLPAAWNSPRSVAFSGNVADASTSQVQMTTSMPVDSQPHQHHQPGSHTSAAFSAFFSGPTARSGQLGQEVDQVHGPRMTSSSFMDFPDSFFANRSVSQTTTAHQLPVSAPATSVASLMRSTTGDVHSQHESFGQHRVSQGFSDPGHSAPINLTPIGLSAVPIPVPGTSGLGMLGPPGFAGMGTGLNHGFAIDDSELDALIFGPEFMPMPTFDGQGQKQQQQQQHQHQHQHQHQNQEQPQPSQAGLYSVDAVGPKRGGSIDGSSLAGGAGGGHLALSHHARPSPSPHQQYHRHPYHSFTHTQ